MAAKPPKPPTNPAIYDNNQHQSTKFNPISQSSISSSSTATSPDDSDDLNSTNNNNNNLPNIIKINNSTTSNYQSYQKITNNLSDCPCTNISIMQLFHEMKQEFPTVPDHIVNQCVIDNCHDRETCIENLKRELASHPNTVQSYPAQILRNNQQIQNQLNSMCNNKVLLKPTRPAPVPKVNNSNINNCNKTILNCNSNNFNSNTIKNNSRFGVRNSKFSDTNKVSLSHKNTVYDVQQTKKSLVVNNCDSENQKEQINTKSQIQSNSPKRPTTLSFREPLPHNQTGGFSNQNQQRIVHKPVRKAPLPPTSKPQQDSQVQHSQSILSPSTQLSQTPQSSQLSHTPSAVPYFPGGSDHSYSSASIQSPLSFSDSGESEISVNISLSPSSDRSRATCGIVGGPITRRTTSITVQPEPPYTRDFISQSPRSYTSLNLTLRKPSTTPQSPIDISAGPGLTYSSSSFDARRGYQKSFHITVTDQGSTFSASRIRPRTTTAPGYNVTSVYPENEMMAAKSSSSTQNFRLDRDIDDVSPLPNMPYNYNNCPQENAVVSLIQRQRNRKDALARCLQKNKQKLERVQNEIKILKSPVKAGESERLDSEIEKLRCDCQNILQEIENTKRIALPNNNNNNMNYYDNQQLIGGQQQMLYYQQQLPHYLSAPPPPPPSLSSLSLQYQQPTIPSDDLEVSIAGRSQRPITTTTTVTLNQQQQQQQQRLLQQQQQQQQQQQYIDETNPDGGPPWTCSMCTFQNHPLLNKCECCDNIRQIPEPSIITSREDIHIHLSPGENRVIHSWIVS